VASRVSAPFAAPRLKTDSTSCDSPYSHVYSFSLSSLLALKSILLIRHQTNPNIEESNFLLEVEQSRVWKEFEKKVGATRDIV
jgi:hypothetical protein